MTWLVTGGAGYIGSHVVATLRATGRSVVVLDDLSTGSAERLGPDVPLVVADAGDEPAVRRAVRRYAVSGVIHCAALTSSEESVRQPQRYYRANVEGTRRLLAAVAGEVGSLVFTSSAAVYGAAGQGVVDERVVPVPITPYGRSKLVGEWMLADAGAIAGVRSIALRLFNVAGSGGAEPGGGARTGLIPTALDTLAAGLAPAAYGLDYATPDGSCVRDYVHVLDVAAAYLRAVDALERGRPGAGVYNVGRSAGCSVLEVLAGAGRVSGLPTEPRREPRRPGDAPHVVADVRRIGAELGWHPVHDLAAILTSEWRCRAPQREPAGARGRR